MFFRRTSTYIECFTIINSTMHAIPISVFSMIEEKWRAAKKNLVKHLANENETENQSK